MLLRDIWDFVSLGQFDHFIRMITLIMLTLSVAPTVIKREVISQIQRLKD